MNSNISFRKMKAVMQSKKIKGVELAEKVGMLPNDISIVMKDKRQPRTDLLAKICSVLEVYPSEIVSFDGITVNTQYFSNDKREPLPKEFTGELTYKPLWIFLADYLAEYNACHEVQKTENDLFDQIEPPRRVKGCKSNNLTSEQLQSMIKKSLESRYGEGYVAKRQNRKPVVSKGLLPVTRTKLRKDRSLNLSVIYEICKKLHCSIDFVLSYK